MNLKLALRASRQPSRGLGSPARPLAVAGMGCVATTSPPQRQPHAQPVPHLCAYAAKAPAVK